MKSKKNNTKAKKSKKTKGKHKKKFLRVLVYSVLVVFLLSLFFLIGYGIYYLCTSSNFNVGSVEYYGYSKYTLEEIEETANITLGKNIFKTSKKEITNNLNSLPYIKSVKIKRSLPDKLKITVTEYDSKYFVYNIEDDSYYRVSDDFVILEKAKGEEKKEDELNLFGISFDDNVVIKDKLALTEIEKILKFEKIFEVYEKSSIKNTITSVEFKDTNVILTLDYELNVIMNDDDLNYRISFLKSIIDNLTSKSGTIDMTKENPVFTGSIR